MNKATEKIFEQFTELERESFYKLVKIDARIGILESWKSYLDEFDDSVFFNIAFMHAKKEKPGDEEKCLASVIIDEWIKDLNDEREICLKPIGAAVYRSSIIEYTNKLRPSFTKLAEDSLFKVITKGYLDNKYGPEDSPSKTAMADICDEIVMYISSTIQSDTFEKIINEDLKNNGEEG